MDDFDEKKGSAGVVNVLPTHGDDEFYTSDEVKVDVHTHVYDGVQRKMKQRHVQMIALAGTLGTGLFLGSGKAIVHAGPAGALLAYALVGMIVYGMIQSLGEIMVFMPISGGYVHFTSRFIHPSMGFAIGWMNWYSGVIGLPTEIISAALIIGFWDTKIKSNKAHLAAYITTLLVLCLSINYFGVRWFGESEFFFACIKILLICGLIIAGLVIDLGGGPNHYRLGFKYWQTPGAFAPYIMKGSKGKFMGWFTTLLQAGYSYNGMEALAITAAECENPRAALTKAVKRIFWRIATFYVVGILIVGMLVPYTNTSLLTSTGNAGSSPFVVAFNLAGVKVLPSIINAGVLTSAFSAGNSGLYGSSRIIYGLALRGDAPKILAKTTKSGLPIVALLFSSVWSLLCFMTLSDGAATVLNWLSNLTTICGFILWATISVTFLRFKAACEYNGIVRKDSKFLYNRFQPFTAYFTLFWSIVVVLGNGYTVFLKGHWDSSSFVIAYINIPIVGVLFLGHWIANGRKGFIKVADIDLVSNVPGPEIDIERDPATTRLGRFMQWLF